EKELRAIYINAIHELIPEAIFLFEEKILFNELNKDEQFEKIKKNKKINYWYIDTSNRIYYNNSGFTFSQIENYVNADYSYDKRVQNIRDKKSNKVDKLNDEIENLNNKIKEIEMWSLQEIFQEVDINEHLGVFSNNSMIRSLIINGYLNEDFVDYITLFHEGNITRADETFKRKVKSGIVSPFEYKLSDKVENLIKDIPDKYFKRSVILNYDLIDFLSENYKQYNSKFDAIISVLSNEKDDSVKFVKGYIERGKNLPLFIKNLCHSWKNWWYFIIESDKQIFTDEILKKYSKLIIENAKVEDILNFNRLHLFQNYVNQKSNFIYLFEKQTFRNILEVLKKLEIKFEKIDNPDENNLFFLKYIYENNLYQINIDNIILMLDIYGNKIDLKNMLESNYSTVLDSGCSKLINYIEYDINSYINNVFLKLEHNSKEKQKNIIKLLNNKEINIVTKTEILLKQETSIFYLTEILDVEVMQMLFDKNKICAIWENVFQYYETLEMDSDLDEVLVNFLNKQINYKVLNNQKIITTLKGHSEEVIKKFSLKIIYCNALILNSYINLLESTPYKWESLAFENLDRDKIEWMVKTGFLILTESNFTKLKNNFSNEHVKLMENQQEKIFTIWDEISLSQEDVLLLLRSK
ncbi:MAG TPA: hypothetical protein PLE28_03680, partial [bacterium]|nr:hypothetical protein [bacterium]